VHGVVFGIATTAICAAGTIEVGAQGYGFYEQGACEMGRAGAGVASPCRDGSAMFFNPAALVDVGTAVVSGGATVASPRGQFTNSTTQNVSTMNDKNIVVPTAYGATAMGRFAVGVGAFVPYGLTVDWPTTSEGRFLSYHSMLKSVYVQPTVAWRVNDQLSIGGGVDITYTSVDLRRRADLAAVTLAPGLTFQQIGVPVGTDFADVSITGNTWSGGGHVGVLVKANDRASFGARYLFRQHATIDNGQFVPTQIATGLVLRVPLPGLPAGTPIDRIIGSAFQTGQALSAQSASTKLPLPDQFVAGVAFRPVANLQVLADYQFVKWSLFDVVTIQNQFAPPTVIPEAYKDTHGVRLGVEYDLGHNAAVRGGFDAHGAGAPDQSVTPLLPEAARQEFSVGATLPLVPHLGVDAAYMYVHQSDRGGTSNGVSNNGTFHYYANLFGVSVVLRW
jgi:long-chain fatty acid transport protein